MPENVQAAIASIKTKENNVNTNLVAGLLRAMEVPQMGGAMRETYCEFLHHISLHSHFLFEHIDPTGPFPCRLNASKQ